jgi:hypothetical protein
MSAVPIFLWEGSLGLWLVVKGFKPSALTAATSKWRVRRRSGEAGGEFSTEVARMIA